MHFHKFVENRSARFFLSHKKLEVSLEAACPAEGWGLWHAYVSFSQGEKNVTLSVALGFAVWISVASPVLRKIAAFVCRRVAGVPDYETATTGVHIDQSCPCIRWDFLAPKYSWDCGTPWWRQGSYYPLGFEKVHSESAPIDEATVVVHMPERVYIGTGRMVEMLVGYSKLPRKLDRKMRRVYIDMHTPVPIPGKGENSWDQDEDTSHSVIMPADSIEEAALRYTENLLRRREKYGGEGWLPAAYMKEAVP